MIRAANVGVVIAELENTPAVRASDYAIDTFKFLKRLLLVHGRLHYGLLSFSFFLFFVL